MTPREYNEGKKLWRAYYASNSFGIAHRSAKYIEVNQLGQSHPLFAPLVTALHVAYANPFTNSENIGSFDERIVPKERIEEHRLLITHRHEIHAHRGGKPFEVPGLGAVNQLIGVRDSVGVGMAVSDFYPRHTAMARIASLIEQVKEAVDKQVEELFQKYHPTIPAAHGQYSLNINDENGAMWIPLKPIT